VFGGRGGRIAQLEVRVLPPRFCKFQLPRECPVRAPGVRRLPRPRARPCRPAARARHVSTTARLVAAQRHLSRKVRVVAPVAKRPGTGQRTSNPLCLPRPPWRQLDALARRRPRREQNPTLGRPHPQEKSRWPSFTQSPRSCVCAPSGCTVGSSGPGRKSRTRLGPAGTFHPPRWATTSSPKRIFAHSRTRRTLE
jgi:hypothetical protein